MTTIKTQMYIYIVKKERNQTDQRGHMSSSPSFWRWSMHGLRKRLWSTTFAIATQSTGESGGGDRGFGIGDGLRGSRQVSRLNRGEERAPNSELNGWDWYTSAVVSFVASIWTVGLGRWIRRETLRISGGQFLGPAPIYFGETIWFWRGG